MDELLRVVCSVLNEIKEFALNELPKVDMSSIRHKVDDADLVSNRDYAMESKIIASIHSRFPQHTVVSEEVGLVGPSNNEHQWLVDPIDGSCNDSHAIPWSCVSVAYVHTNQLMAAIVIHLQTREVFQAVRGYGSTLNDRPLRISNVDSLAGSVVFTELTNQHPWDGMFHTINLLAARNATVRIMGATALAITQIAAGRGAAAILDTAGKLDVAAGILIALEAGAVVLQDGKLLEGIPEGRLIIAPPGVVERVQEIVSTAKRSNEFSNNVE
jgi:myo-inositol-1(or 4)-monophosphatase